MQLHPMQSPLADPLDEHGKETAFLRFRKEELFPKVEMFDLRSSQMK